MSLQKNPWALILGGSSGMGWASVQKLARDGFNLVVLYRERKQQARETELHLQELKQQYNRTIISFNKDALSNEVVQAVAGKLKNEGIRLSLLLHSIAKGNLKLMVPVKKSDTRFAEKISAIFEDEKYFLEEQDFQLTIQAMALSYYNWVKVLHDSNCLAQEAMMLALTSEGSSRAWRNYAAVSAAKASLEAISRSIALEFAPYGIRSNILQPGVTDTRALRFIKGHELIRARSEERNPFGRLTTPDDVANVVYLMSRKEALWINGAVIPVDGGESVA